MSDAPALIIAGLQKWYGGLHATRNVHIDIHAGQIHAIIGPNGAGKTTLLSLLSGAIPADAGEIHLFGNALHPHAEQERVAAGLVRSFQITSVFNELSVMENFLVALQRRHGGFGFFRASVKDTADREAALAIARRVGLEKCAQTAAARLSHGQRRRLDVGLAIACQPKVLLLDEPLAGLGADESEAMVELIRSLKDELTVVMVEHDMEAVFSLADRITVLVQGAMLVTGTVDEIRNSAEVKTAYLGEEEVAV